MEFREEYSPEDLSDIWSKYGLKCTPYNTSPTRIIGIFPIEKVFSGRKESVKRLKLAIRSNNSSRNLVVGEFGVGKTTFANFVKWNMCIKDDHKSKYLVTQTDIKVQPTWDATKFLISTLSAIYTANIIYGWDKQGYKLSTIKKIKELIDITQQINISGGIVGVSGGFEKNVSGPTYFSLEILENLLIETCNELKEYKKEIIVSYDNLENIPNESLSELFKSIRDYLQIEGLHSIFIGPPEVISAVEKYGQVHSVFNRPIILDCLEEFEVVEILNKRCEILKLEGADYITPYEEEALKQTYRRLNKNLRFTFKVFEDATLNSIEKAPCKISIKDIVVVQEKEKQEIISTLTKKQLKIISVLLEIPRINQTELSIKTKTGTTNLTTPLRELEKIGLITIEKDRNDRRLKYIRLSNNSYLKLFFNPEEIK